MRIALDAMGGDYAPGVNVCGAIEALNASPELEILLVGDQAQLDLLVNQSGYSGERLTIVPADGHVGMDEKPTQALRDKKNCSIAVCWKLMADKQVDAVVSAGNTGGVVAFGLMTRLFLKGVKRPGIGVVLPTINGPALLMDAGANPGAKAEHLAQYAVMGSVYARHVLNIATPRVGVINIGSEDGKGNSLVCETAELICAGSVRELFIGNVEGRGIYEGDADVIICEGFVGNVVLKVSEGMATMVMKMVSKEVLDCLNHEKPLAAQALMSVGRRYEYNETGGAPLLGVDGICMICHGSSDARSIRNAIRTATTLRDREVNRHIVEHLDC